MKWLTLESSMLSAVAYNGAQQLLYLRSATPAMFYHSTPPDFVTMVRSPSLW
jgi:hypothetical protein